MENTFDSLCALLNLPECKAMFLEAEGAELMIIMMKYVLHTRKLC
jgi:beta-catenin-like protein 1